MTQAFNLSQLANNLNTAGQLDATDGLVNAVPVANGGTGASTEAAARTNLNVPTRTGGDASGTWGISISGNAATATSATTASSATFATTAGNGGVTSVNGSTGAVTVSTTPTTAQVLNATAGASLGAVGTYAFLSRPSYSATVINPGDTIAGSNLRYAGGLASGAGLASISGTAPSGTWRAMGYANNVFGCCNASEFATLFLRIS
jgi:hypothetical protein